MDGPDTGHVVYFIVADVFVKVGYSNDVWARLRELQTGNPHELILAHTIGYPDAATARKAERVWQQRFRDATYPRMGEWFELQKIPQFCGPQKRGTEVRLVSLAELMQRPPGSKADMVEGAMQKYGLMLCLRREAA